MTIPKFDRQALLDTITARLSSLRRYIFVIFVLFVAGLYSFVLFRVNSLSHAQPVASDVTSQVKAAAIPHIDQAVVKQLQSLQDNSVSVQALFNQARSNPFQ